MAAAIISANARWSACSTTTVLAVRQSRWPDLVEWNHLLAALQAPVAALAAAGGEYLNVRGVISIDDSVGMVQFAKESQPSLGGSLAVRATQFFRLRLGP